MGEIVKLIPAGQEAEPDMDTLKTNFRKEMASLFVAAEWNEIPREWLLGHLEMVASNVRESLKPEGKAREKAILDGK